MSYILLDKNETAQLLQKSTKTLDLWRKRGYGPAYLRIGGTIRYDRQAVDAFLESCQISPDTSDGNEAKNWQCNATP